MPVHLNQIGDFEFIDLIGNIAGRQERIELFERAGVEGHGARKNKVAGEPFQLVAIRYVEDFDSAAAEFTELLAATGTVVEVTQNTVNYGEYLQLHVARATPPQAVFGVIGGVTDQQDSDDNLEDSDLEVRTEYVFTLIWKADPTPP